MKPRFCPECGARLAEGARFCSGCGSAVRDPEKAAPPPAPAERRQVVVMFADLAGYTSLTSQLDPEETHRLLGRYFEVVDGVVASYGGTVDKHIGDAVMALFGAPVAHHDDAERAVRAATAIHAGLAHLASEAGVELRAHVGIAAGEVVAAGTGSATHSTYTVTGDAVNLASRLEGMAQAGQTLVAATVWRAVAAFCDGEPAGHLAIRGLEAPVEAWRVLGCHAAARTGPPLVGREDELRQFEAALAAVAMKRTGRLVLLRGEPGIGKTRLAEACIERAGASGFACHRALVLDFGVARGRGAIAALVAGLLGADSSAEADVRRTALDHALASGSAARDDEPFLVDLLELPQSTQHRAAYEAMDSAARTRARHAALAALVAAAAQRAPRLFVVEDLHWADADTLESLSAFARACASNAALLVATTRIVGDPIDARWRAAAGPLPSITLDLDRLGTAAATALARAIVGRDERRVAACIDRAEGNPLFLVQLLRDTGDGAGVPGTIASLVQSRIDRLALPDRNAVQAAAVIGQRFGLPLLQHLLGDAGYGCEALVDHFLVRPDAGEYLFAHALICDGAYASLLHGRKRALHAAAAQWYAGRDAQLRARHLDRAGDPAAAAAYLDAAREQSGMLRLEAALAFAERAVALAADASTRHDAAMLRAELLRDAGRTVESIAAFEGAAREAPDDAGRCRALIGVAAGHRLAGAPDAALAALDRAQPLAAALALGRETSNIHHLRGNLHFARGAVDACAAEHAAALASARAVNDVAAEANAQSGLGDALYAKGRMRSALASFAACVALARDQGLLRVVSANLCMMGHSRAYAFEWDEGLGNIAEADGIAQRLGLPHAQMFARESTALMHYQRGELDQAAVAARDALQRARAVGSRRFEALLMWLLAMIALRGGDRDAARALAAEVRAIVVATGIGGFLGPQLCTCEAALADDATQRRRLLAEGETWLDRGALGHCHFWYHRDAIDVALSLEDGELALRHADAMEAYTRDEPLPWSDLLVERARALVAWRRAPDDASRKRLATVREAAVRHRFADALRGFDAALS